VFEMKKVFKLLRRTVLSALLVGFLLLSGLPVVSSAQAAPSNFSGQGQDLSKTGVRPYGEREGADIKQANIGGKDAEQATEKVNQLVDRGNSNRPKTTGDWNKEAREVEGSPRERLQRIGEQSGEALKEFGSVYPDTAERSANSNSIKGS